MKASDLLDIDVAGELQAVCREQLRGSWQVAAELARLGLQRGAQAVDVTSLRNGFSLSCPGASIGLGELADLHALGARSADLGQRHDAVGRLEASHAQALLWAIGVERSRVEVTAWQGGMTCVLRARLGGGSTLEHSDCPGRPNGFEVRVTSPRLDRRRTLRWFGAALRFASVPVRINGRRHDGGFAECLFEIPIQQPLRGRIAITGTGDAPHLWLLRHGVLATRATVPGFPAFEAALEMGQEVRAAAGPDELREGVNQYLPELIDRAVTMMVETADGLPTMAEESRDRLTCLLLRAAGKGLLRDRILALPLVRMADGAEKAHWHTLNELTASGRTMIACDALDRFHRGSVGDGAPVVLASAEQRGLLAELLGITLQQLPRQPRPFDVRRSAAMLRRVRDRLSRLMWGLSGGRVVPEEDLLAPERSLLDDLNRRSAPSIQVRMCAGAGPIRRRGRVLLLPRQNQLVTGSVRLASDGEGWRYPVVLALLGDLVGQIDRFQDRWLRHTLTLDGSDASEWRRNSGAGPPVG